MKLKNKFIYSFSISFLLGLLIFSGCVQIPQPHLLPQDPRIEQILTTIKTQNSNLHTFNGIGSITIIDPYRVSTYRLAWAGQCPDKIRMVVLFSGNPIETMSTDGESLYIKSHNGRHPFINTKAKNPNLERLISVPVTTEQVIGFLSGHIPVQPHDYATLQKTKDEKGLVLVLKKGNTMVEQFILDDHNRVLDYEIFGDNGTRYHITLNQHETSDLLFPNMIQSSQGERSCTIHVEKNTPNPDLTPDTFKILNE